MKHCFVKVSFYCTFADLFSGIRKKKRITKEHLITSVDFPLVFQKMQNTNFNQRNG